MKSKFLIIALREYIKNVRKISFWLSTLFFPLLIVGASLLSGLSANSVERKLKEEAKNAKSILVLDEAKVLNNSLITEPFKNISEKEKAIEEVKNKNVDALIVIPSDIDQTNEVEIYLESKGVFAKDRYNELAKNLIKQSILLQVGDERKIKIFNAEIKPEVVSYQNGQIVDEGFQNLAIPVIGLAIYFTLISFATNYMLFSVAEEKENRMIEIVITAVKPKTLILGKMIGQVATVLTQLLVLSTFAIVGFLTTKAKLPIDLSAVDLRFVDVVMIIFYVLMGFLIIGNMMVAVGAATPSYKESKNFAAVFIMMAIFPLYFFTIILADPSGSVAKAVSYFPFTGPMILLFRFTLGELHGLELILSSILMIFYAWLTYIIAVKLFEFGSLEYNNNISLRDFLKRKKKNA